MQIDSTDYLRLDVLYGLGTSATGASFATSSGDVLDVQCHGPGAFRLRVGPSTRPDYGVVVSRSKACTTAQTAPRTWAIACGESRLEIAGGDLELRLAWKDRVVLRSASDRAHDGGKRLPALGRLRQGGLWSTAFALATGEPVYGLGEKFGPLDKRGQLLHSRVEDAQGVNSGLSGGNAPFAWSGGAGRGAWGVFVHTPGTVTHAVGHPDWSHRSYALMVDDEALDVFLLGADDPAGIVDLYTQTTGRASPVPRWSFGLCIARPVGERADASAACAARLRERKIPADLLVVDADAVASGDHAAGGPDAPPLAELAGSGFRLAVRETPQVDVDAPLFQELASQDYLLATPEGEPYVCAASEGAAGAEAWREYALVDFTHPDAFVWWRDAYAQAFENGADALVIGGDAAVPDDAAGYNGERGSRLHNAFPLLHARCASEATARHRTPHAGAPFVLATAGWTGSQRQPLRLGPPAQADWEGLAATVRGALSAGMSGEPCYAASIGGGDGETASPELFARWLQAGVFLSHLCLPGGPEREPWSFGADAEGVVRKWLALRYRLIPYLEQAMAESMRTGLPIARAMPLAFPESRLVRHFETQFMCGDALLVAPILREGGEVDIALPPGVWYDLNTRARYAGSQVLRYAAKLDQFPVFGREGCALPLGRAVQHTGQIHAELPLEAIWVFGKPARPLDGYRQARIDADRIAGFTVRAMLNVDVQVFGEPSAVSVLPL